MEKEENESQANWEKARDEFSAGIPTAASSQLVFGLSYRILRCEGLLRQDAEDDACEIISALLHRAGIRDLKAYVSTCARNFAIARYKHLRLPPIESGYVLEPGADAQMQESLSYHVQVWLEVSSSDFQVRRPLVLQLLDPNCPPAAILESLGATDRGLVRGHLRELYRPLAEHLNVVCKHAVFPEWHSGRDEMFIERLRAALAGLGAYETERLLPHGSPCDVRGTIVFAEDNGVLVPWSRNRLPVNVRNWTRSTGLGVVPRDWHSETERLIQSAPGVEVLVELELPDRVVRGLGLVSRKGPVHGRRPSGEVRLDPGLGIHLAVPLEVDLDVVPSGP